MPRNPLLQNDLSAGDAGLQREMSVNDAFKKYFQGKNKFPMSYKFSNTLRFAEATPFFAMNCIGGDIVQFANNHTIRTHTMNSPKIESFQMRKSFFAVNMRAILPNTFEFIYKNPTRGDDVPSDAYCYVDLNGCARTYLDSFNDSDLTEMDSPADDSLVTHFKSLLVLESLFSRGSLLSSLGIPLRDCLVDWAKDSEDGFDIDDVVDLQFRWLFEHDQFVYRFPEDDVDISYRYYAIKDGLTYVDDNDVSQPVIYISRHNLMDMMRDNPTWSIVGDFWDQYIPTSDLSSEITDFDLVYSAVPPIDISRVLAYQLAMFTLMTDDSIDYIYTSELFRSYFRYLCSYVGYGPETFNFNGQDILYDVFSAHYLNNVLSMFEPLLPSALFTYRRTLRYEDYLVGSRPQPYALGDLSAPVTDSSVSAIDINRSLWKQRFENAVNRIGNRWRDYVQLVSGVDPIPDPTEAKFLTSQVFPVDGYEVENTGSAQMSEANSVTTLIKTTGGNFVFEAMPTEPCIIIGVCSWGMDSFYTSQVDRFAYHKDRYDFFNKFFQYDGDQEIRPEELSAAYADDSLPPFAYTLRYMEYKQCVNRCSGGFVKGLKNWILKRNPRNDFTLRPFEINSEFIRNHNGDIDSFYTSLTGLSLGSYYHFQVKFTNFNTPYRPMEFTPSPL